MALIKCKECGGMVSDKATVCPHCGAPLDLPHDTTDGKPAETDDAAPRSEGPASECDPVKQEASSLSPQPAARPLRVHRKVWVLAGVAVLLLVLVFTCPNRQAHVEAMDDALSQALSASLDEAIDAPTNDLLQDPGGWAASLLGSGLSALVSKAVSSQMLQVNNYGVCSVGRLVAGRESSVVTLGLAGHVFTLFSQSSLQKTIDRYLNKEKTSPRDAEPDDADEPDEDLDDEAI